jgi:hypothetical protein
MQRDKLEQLQAQIETGVAQLVGGQDWQRWLAVAARFPKYSFRNQLLILSQRPDARVAMGYRAWQALGHQVRRGEQSISILAPCTYKAKKTKTDKTDLEADTAGDDQANAEDAEEDGQVRRVLRVPGRPRLRHHPDRRRRRPIPRTASAARRRSARRVWDTLAAQIRTAGYTLNRSDIANGANGVTNFNHRTVTIAPHLSPAQAAKTLAHELAHVTMPTAPNTPPPAAAPSKSKPNPWPTSSARPPGSPPPPIRSR